MILSLIIFFIGAYGFILNRKNIIIILLCIEIILLSVTLLILLSSYIFDDIIGQTFGIFIIAVAGAESSLGLGLLVAYYRIRGNINLN
jgi:NADH-ubiquinone oxidoreductase chain 4L